MDINVTGIVRNKRPVKYSSLRSEALILLLLFAKPLFSQTLNIYFGDLHSHTSYSDGQATPADAYSQARESGKADFLAVTDHSWFSDELWAKAGQASQDYTDEKFLAIRGFELTTAWGHMNVYNTDWYVGYTEMLPFYSILVSHKQCIAQWNHPTDYSDEFSGFAHFSPELDSVINMLEVINLKRNLKFESSYIRALDKGWHVGPTANSDMHNSDWITGYDTRTAILSTGLTKQEIFSALREHRTYATEDRNLHIFYRINGAVMGSVLPDPAECKIEIQIADPDSFDPGDRIRMVEIISNKGTIIDSRIFNENKVVWNLELEKTGSGSVYYYLRVTNKDGLIAITAPVWLEYRAEKEPDTAVVEKNNRAIYDLSGKLIKSAQTGNHLMEPSPGVYIVSDQNSNGLPILRTK